MILHKAFFFAMNIMYGSVLHIFSSVTKCYLYKAENTGTGQINLSIAFPYDSIDKVSAARHCDPYPYQTITMSEAGTLDEQSMIYMDISALLVTCYWSGGSQGD